MLRILNSHQRRIDCDTKNFLSYFFNAVLLNILKLVFILLIIKSVCKTKRILNKMITFRGKKHSIFYWKFAIRNLKKRIFHYKLNWFQLFHWFTTMIRLQIMHTFIMFKRRILRNYVLGKFFKKFKKFLTTTRIKSHIGK